MAKIIQIRGTSGSGKTHTAYEVMKRLGVLEKVYASGQPVEAYILNAKGNDAYTALIGKYETDCGGCDSIKTQDEICRRVRHYAAHGSNVVFEGLLISQIYERYYNLARELQAEGHDYAFAYLDTPVEVCVEQVKSRRFNAFNVKLQKALKRNTHPDKLPILKPLDETNTRSKHRDCERNRKKDLDNGMKVIDLIHDGDPAAQVLEFLGVPAEFHS